MPTTALISIIIFLVVFFAMFIFATIFVTKFSQKNKKSSEGVINNIKQELENKKDEFVCEYCGTELNGSDSCPNCGASKIIKKR